MTSENEELVIVLQLKEGIGFNKGCEKVFFQASIGNHKLDHEPRKANHTTLFNCNLIWETDKASIKNIKLENIPIKIDIYGLRSNANNEHIGYVLIPIRSVPVLPLSKALQAKCRWYKLIGLSSEWRAHRPEIHLNAMITNSSYMTCEKSKLEDVNQEKKKPVIASDSIVLDENPNPCMMMISQKGMFIRVLQSEGLLQVGNIDTNADIFNIKIVMKNIKQMGNLLEKCSLQPSSDPELFINYILLGNNHSRKLDKKFNRTYKIQEKISINFRSSLKSLHEYFNDIFYIPIELYLDSRMIGSVEIRLDKLIDTFSLEEFLEKYPKSLAMNETVEISTIFPPKENENQPFLEYSVSLQYQTSRQLHQFDLLSNYKANTSGIDSKAGGDFTTNEPEIDKNLKTTSNKVLFESETHMASKLENNVTEMQVSPVLESHNENKIDTVEIITKDNVVQEKEDDIEEIPHLFCFSIRIHSLKFNKKPGKGVWQISFFHERADTQRAYINREISDEEINENNEIVFENLTLKLYFSSHIKEIENVIQTQPHICTLCIKGPYNIHVKGNLDCYHLMIVSKENSTGNIFLNHQNDSITAFAQVSVLLNDEGFNFNSNLAKRECNDANKEQENLTDLQNRMLFDENIAYKMILELEEWKNIERQKFLQELKQAEQEHLQKVKKEFEQKSLNYEEQINEKKNILSELTYSLENAKKSLEMRASNILNEEKKRFEQVREELEKAYQEKISIIQMQNSYMKQDLEQQILRKDIEIDKLKEVHNQLHAQIRELQHERFDLKECLENLKAENESLKATFVPKDELEMLLTELKSLKDTYEEVRQSKNFYKEQWAKLTRENNKLRQENRISIRDNIFDVKYEEFYDALSEEYSLLNFDKDELDEIKMHLNVK
ncbi:hypothetical protein PVAND_006564 [Polypedilum vanderplanki]|uniref:DUF3668 domain-containing protein n=1 Tax=Polypedilum vanderplanki TaxID=319348 RepID=A0A9J6C4K6_POLVA|nr:hypothetical protein PVAND_006564 [Polypedilum vanderplanki]